MFFISIYLKNTLFYLKNEEGKQVVSILNTVQYLMLYKNKILKKQLRAKSF